MLTLGRASRSPRDIVHLLTPGVVRSPLCSRNGRRVDSVLGPLNHGEGPQGYDLLVGDSSRWES